MGDICDVILPRWNKLHCQAGIGSAQGSQDYRLTHGSLTLLTVIYTRG